MERWPSVLLACVGMAGSFVAGWYYGLGSGYTAADTLSARMDWERHFHALRASLAVLEPGGPDAARRAHVSLVRNFVEALGNTPSEPLGECSAQERDDLRRAAILLGDEARSAELRKGLQFCEQLRESMANLKARAVEAAASRSADQFR